MAKKRKAIGQPFGEPKAKSIDNGAAKLVVNNYKDIADSEEEFDLDRDKILIDETPAQKQRRKIQEHNEVFEPSDEEVYAHSSDESEIDDEGEDEESYGSAGEDGISERRLPVGKASTRHAGTRYGDESDASKQSDGDDLGGWGSSKNEYYNADQIETEADALEEEAEAIRLQKKQLQTMTDADFGFDETEWLDASTGDIATSESQGGIVREVLPQLEIADDVGPEERIKILKARYPEFQYLAQEFMALQAKHEEWRLKALQDQTLQGYIEGRADEAPDKATKSIVTSVSKLKLDTLSSYLGAISVYFALLTAPQEDENKKPKAMNPTELHDHPIMDLLLICRNSWGMVKEIPEPDSVETANKPISLPSRDTIHNQGLDLKGGPTPKPKTKNQRKSKAQKAYDTAIIQARVDRAARIQRAEEDLKKLEANLSTRLPSLSKTANVVVEDDSDFGEEAYLNEYDAEEKAKRKKSLQFYTSQIVQKANKRGNASRNAGGDDDIPYKERLKDRQERLNKEAEARGTKGRDTIALANGMKESSEDEDPMPTGKTPKEPQSSDDEYYDQMISRPAALKATKKAEKTAAYNAALAAQAEADGGRVVAVEQVGPDGKRAIGYTIEKNKGLAPHRKKDVRNPRVKKRKKFEEKKKKQRNMRPVWKGGEGKGGYGGELTGIKKGIVRGIKL